MMRKLTLKDIQNIELNLLRLIRSFCDSHGIKVYLCGGTLLGAIRHQGFIPWDDDIDVCMSRPDFEKFIKLASGSEEFSGTIKLYSYDLGNAEYPYIRVVDTQTHINQIFSEDTSDSSIYIDLLPVDGLPNDRKEVKRVYRKTAILRKILMLNWAKTDVGSNRIKTALKPILKPIIRMIGAERICKMLDTLSKKYSYEESDYVGIVSWGLYGPAERMPKKMFEKQVKILFEGEYYNTMSCWEGYLKRLYGDYMKMPPEDERKIHLIDAWIDKDD